MRSCADQLKKEFLKKWVKGLQICYPSKKEMSVVERKKRIKLSADIALASAKNGASSWSNALIFEAKKDEGGAILVHSLLGPEPRFEPQIKTAVTCMYRRVQSHKILKNSRRRVGRRSKQAGPPPPNSAAYIAKRLVKKRTQVLKRLVPGGESMDEFSLIKEALDYILSLRVQVGVMRSLANATEVLTRKSQP